MATIQREREYSKVVSNGTTCYLGVFAIYKAETENLRSLVKPLVTAWGWKNNIEFKVLDGVILVQKQTAM